MATEYLTVDEAAAILRVSARTLRRWVAEGLIAHRRFGATIRIPRSATEMRESARREGEDA